MNGHDAASAYKTSIIENAPPLKVVQLMYEGALRLVATGRALDPVEQFSEYNDCLNRAGAIVAELRLALDPGHAPDLTAQLETLYHFVERQLREAFLDKNQEPLESAENVLRTLLDAWRQLNVDVAEGAA